MVKGTLSNGFEYSVSKKRFHSMIALRKLSKLDTDTPIKYVLDTYEFVLGAECVDGLMEYCDSIATEERFGDDLFAEAIDELFTALRSEEELKN